MAFVPPNPNPHRHHSLPAPHTRAGEQGVWLPPGSLHPSPCGPGASRGLGGSAELGPLLGSGLPSSHLKPSVSCLATATLLGHKGARESVGVDWVALRATEEVGSRANAQDQAGQAPSATGPARKRSPALDT